MFTSDNYIYATIINENYTRDSHRGLASPTVNRDRVRVRDRCMRAISFKSVTKEPLERTRCIHTPRCKSPLENRDARPSARRRRRTRCSRVVTAKRRRMRFREKKKKKKNEKRLGISSTTSIRRYLDFSLSFTHPSRTNRSRIRLGGGSRIARGTRESSGRVRIFEIRYDILTLTRL